MSILDIFKKKKEGNAHYITASESKRIMRENAAAIKYYEKRKKRKVVEEEFLTEMKDENNVIEFENLHTYFFSDAGVVKAVNGVTFSIPAGSTVGVVGESGCGKSVTSLSLMQLVQGPSGQIVDGSIRFKTNSFVRDEEGNKIPMYEMNFLLKGNKDPMSALNGLLFPHHKNTERKKSRSVFFIPL